MIEPPRRCAFCGHELGPSDNFCPSCGRGATPMSPPDHKTDPYLLLMTANMLRLRHQFALAEAKCSEVLALDPENAAARSLMGDILRDQGREEDALEWYKMAVDRDPANEADRRKLEALIDHRFSNPPPSRLQPTFTAVRKLAQTARAEVRAARPMCPWAMVTAAIFAVTLLGAFTMVVVGRRTISPSGPASPGESTAFVAEADLSPTPTAPSPASPKPAGLTGDIAALEHDLLEQLRLKSASVDPNGQVEAVRLDPKQAAAEVEISLPAYWSPVSARRAIGRLAIALAIAAAQSDDRLRSVRVRASVRPSSGPDQLAMVAEAKADALRRQAEPPADSDPEKVFATLWWEAAIAPENDSSSFTPPLAGGGTAAAGGH